jgi:glycosyltransferase involved in cell wall biosynthesis
MKISAVIPTRNRPLYLHKAIASLLKQSRPLDEIIVVDSSDDKASLDAIKTEYLTFRIIWIDTIASVCFQRNTGVRESSGDWILLCDDDIELDADYVEQLESYSVRNPYCGALAGRLLQRENNQWVEQYPVNTFRDLMWRFVFQLSIWGEIARVSVPSVLRPIYWFVKKFYTGRQNTLTLAGWPLITQWDTVFQTTIYSLGANLIRKEWLLRAPYDEVLDPAGIGDNYGVALNFSGPVHVLSTVKAYHHRATNNRLKAPLIYYRRILALHYFIKRNKKLPLLTTVFYIWSLLGNSILFLVKGQHQMFKLSCKAIGLIIRSKNPYWSGFVNNEKFVTPE